MPADTALYHIILWSCLSIGAALFYACISLLNMEVTNDSLLFSKVCSPALSAAACHLGRAPRLDLKAGVPCPHAGEG